SLASQLAVDSDFAGNRGDLVREHRQRVDHAIDGVGELRNLAARLEYQLALEIAIGDRGHNFGDTAHLRGEVLRHEVDVIGKVLPGAGHAFDRGLAAELAFGADLAGHARHLRRKGVELVDHGIDRTLELKNLAFDVDGNLFAQVAIGHCGRYVGD